MTWNLQFDKEHRIMNYFDDCPDRQRQNLEIQALINKYSDPKYSPLEIGCGCAKYAPNWKVLDPYDKRELVDYRIGLEQVKDHPELIGKFDFIKACAIFEHVRNMFDCAEGVFLLLKTGGEFIGDFPFVFPYHPFKGYKEEIHGLLADKNIPEFKEDEQHGLDGWRYSPQAIKILFPDNKFECISLEKTNAGSFIYRGRKK